MAVAPAAAVSNNKEEGTDRPTTGFEGAPVVGKAFDGSPVTQQWEGETARPKLSFGKVNVQIRHARCVSPRGKRMTLEELGRWGFEVGCEGEAATRDLDLARLDKG
jgi:hypothetical protein